MDKRHFELVQKVNDLVERLEKMATGRRSVRVLLHQAINTQSDEITLEKIIAFLEETRQMWSADKDE